MIIICIDSFPPSRRGSHVMSDYARTIIQHTPLSHRLGTCTLISVVAPIDICSCDPLQVNSNQSVGGRSDRTQEPSKICSENSIIYISTKVLHSILFRNIFRRLQRHPSAVQGHFHTIHPNLPRSTLCPPFTPSTPFWPYGTHPFFPNPNHLSTR